MTARRREGKLPSRQLYALLRKIFLDREKRAVVVVIRELLARSTPRYCYKTVTKKLQNVALWG